MILLTTNICITVLTCACSIWLGSTVFRDGGGGGGGGGGGVVVVVVGGGGGGGGGGGVVVVAISIPGRL